MSRPGIIIDEFGDMLRSFSALQSGKYNVYPSYLAMLTKRALKTLDTESIVREVGDSIPLGNSAYAIPVTDFNGKKYRITVECVNDEPREVQS